MRDYPLFIGKKYGKLEILGVCKVQTPTRELYGFECKCECGNYFKSSVYGIINGTTTSCGCNYRSELLGKRFGMLLAVERITIGVSSNQYRCVCDCGNQKIIKSGELKRGNHKSCGCNRTPRKTYEYRSHPLYDVWKGMKSRCRDKKHISYKNYGAIGVSVCEEWQNDFFSFYEWAINNGYKDGLHLDKDIIAIKTGQKANLYSPDRCQFVTPHENSQYTRKKYKCK